LFLAENNNTNPTSRTFTETFSVGWHDASPDGYTRPILGINDTFPAPTIIVQKGDRINITVFNRANEPTTIHWHGIEQRNSLIMDGVPGVTQCSIQPNSSYNYMFDTGDQAGTFWYHSHYAIQYGDGLKGALIIQDPNDPWKDFYDDEDILQISDWYHTPLYILVIPVITHDILEPTPETGLINGIGQYNCTTTGNCSYYRATIRPNTTKRFRIICTAVMLTITLTIDQHEMRVIEADGINLDGNKVVQSLRLNPGQRYSVLVTAKQIYNQSYWIRTTLHPPHTFNPGEYETVIQPNVSAILQYVNDTNVNVSVVIPSMDTFDNDAMVIQQSILDARQYSDEPGIVPMNTSENRVPTNGTIRTFLYNSMHQGTNPGGFYFNNLTFTQGDNSTLLAAVLNGNSAEIDAQPGNRIEADEIIDVIINNINFDPHPFHLHGHPAWLIAAGQSDDGYYNESTRSQIVYDTTNATYRDTYTINPNSYFVFRFKANNPGVWMMHCHNDWHVQLGMSMVFIESPDIVRTFFANQTSIAQVQSSCPDH
jgi:iron transport multicopper oxidase